VDREEIPDGSSQTTSGTDSLGSSIFDSSAGYADAAEKQAITRSFACFESDDAVDQPPSFENSQMNEDSLKRYDFSDICIHHTGKLTSVADMFNSTTAIKLRKIPPSSIIFSKTGNSEVSIAEQEQFNPRKSGTLIVHPTNDYDQQA
jgi:hypothetical protein